MPALAVLLAAGLAGPSSASAPAVSAAGSGPALGTAGASSAASRSVASGGAAKAAGEQSAPLRLRSGQTPAVSPAAKAATYTDTVYFMPIYWTSSAPSADYIANSDSYVARSDSYWSSVTNDRLGLAAGWKTGWTRISLSSSEIGRCDVRALAREVSKLLNGGGRADHVIWNTAPLPATTRGSMTRASPAPTASRAPTRAAA